MLKNTILKGIVGAAMYVLLAAAPNSILLSNTATAAPTSCLPGSIKARLNQIRQKFGRVSIVSTHRRGARIAGTGKKSYHASCRAVDFHPPKGKYRAVVSWLKANHKGGVGTYSCGMHHIHLDNGPKIRFHKCVNRYGARIGKKRHYAKRKIYKKHKTKKRYAKAKKYKNTKNYYALGAKPGTKKKWKSKTKTYVTAPVTLSKQTFSFYNY